MGFRRFVRWLMRVEQSRGPDGEVLGTRYGPLAWLRDRCLRPICRARRSFGWLWKGIVLALVGVAANHFLPRIFELVAKP